MIVIKTKFDVGKYHLTDFSTFSIKKRPNKKLKVKLELKVHQRHVSIKKMTI